MLPMIPLEGNEVVAMFQFLARSRRDGRPFWSTFWKGGTIEGGTEDKRSPVLQLLPERPAEMIRVSMWGISHPWTLWASTALGLWLIFSPYFFGTTGPAADLDHLAGALRITISVLALGEVFRMGRFLNLPLGLGLAVSAFLVDGGGMAWRITDGILAILIVALALPKGPKRESYGSWDRFIR